MPRPMLSIGIIFKNEIRCLERCLKSLQPLRDAVPCELVMADTGSDDGSRGIAERYADVLFDFPWINDFAAARNAVIDRCSGRWFLSIDADEWLEDAAPVADALRRGIRKELDACTVCIRNLMDVDDLSDARDFYVMRLMRMSAGVRYAGAVHEYMRGPDGNSLRAATLPHAVLLHDGYIGLNDERGKAKRQRNQALLDACLEQDPEDVRSLLQYIESSRPDPQHMEYIHRGLAAVEAKNPGWEIYGPPIFRYAILAAQRAEKPDLEEQWSSRAVELFPNSFYTNIDIACLRLSDHWDKKEHAACIPWGERYLAAIEDYAAGRGDKMAQRVSTLLFTAPEYVKKARTAMVICCRETGRPGCALKILKKFDLLDVHVVTETLTNLRELQVSTDEDTTDYMLRFYERIISSPDKGQSKEQMTAFLSTGSLAFSQGTRKQETSRTDFHRHGYTLFAPLAGKCGLGTAAAVLSSDDPAEIASLLGGVEKWNELPFPAVSHAMKKGVPFPLPGKPLKLEEMDGLARRLAGEWDELFSLMEIALAGEFSAGWQELSWARALVLAAVVNCNWENEEQGLALAEAFARVERMYNMRCYTPEVLCEENIFVLPPMHRFGWYCGRAFDTLEAGDAAGYARLLQQGLTACGSMKPMVKFLTEHTPQLKPPVPPELLELTEKVRSLLSAYAPDDPAVIALKQSPVYQKVAHLIEGPETVGGLQQ